MAGNKGNGEEKNAKRGWCPSWVVGGGAWCRHLSLWDPEHLTQRTFQEMAEPLCRRMPGNPAAPSSSEDGGSSSWSGNSKLSSGGWPGGWGGKAPQLFVGRQGTASLCPFVSILSQESSMPNHSLCAGEDWGLSQCAARHTRPHRIGAGNITKKTAQVLALPTLYQVRGSREAKKPVGCGWAGS